ncbi:hypothetical protein XELAEV_18002511mg [Xenopus laevis]|nr:hypothetical protein XELAEV_18002511mg [Xenopus laevis]
MTRLEEHLPAKHFQQLPQTQKPLCQNQNQKMSKVSGGSRRTRARRPMSNRRGRRSQSAAHRSRAQRRRRRTGTTRRARTSTARRARTRTARRSDLATMMSRAYGSDYRS